MNWDVMNGYAGGGIIAFWAGLGLLYWIGTKLRRKP